jgi:hypothetical protein
LNSGPTTWAILSVFFAWVIFQIGASVYVQAGLDCDPPTYALGSSDYRCMLPNPVWSLT